MYFFNCIKSDLEVAKQNQKPFLQELCYNR